MGQGDPRALRKDQIVTTEAIIIYHNKVIIFLKIK